MILLLPGGLLLAIGVVPVMFYQAYGQIGKLFAKIWILHWLFGIPVGVAVLVVCLVIGSATGWNSDNSLINQLGVRATLGFGTILGYFLAWPMAVCSAAVTIVIKVRTGRSNMLLSGIIGATIGAISYIVIRALPGRGPDIFYPWPLPIWLLMNSIASVVSQLACRRSLSRIIYRLS